MKKIYTLALLIVFGISSKLSAQCSTSSTPFMNCSYYGDYISAFTLNNIASVGNAGCATSGYSLYATPVRTLVLGNTYSWTCSAGTSYANGLGIWIDWNNDNSWSSSEMVAADNYAFAHSGTITVPFNAVTGTNIRMRVSCGEYYTYSSNTSACTTAWGYGETEDYYLYISCPSSVPVPSVALTNSYVCAGETVTLTASGAQTYTWLGGPGNVVNGVGFTPSVSATYTVIAGITGCPSSTNTAVRTISVTNVPLVISVSSSNSLVCGGSTATLSATGANNFTWTPGNLVGSNVIVSPSANTIYTAVGYNGSLCPGTSTVALSVSPQPTITAAASSTQVCAGSSVTLTATGGNTYSWTPGGAGASVVVNPNVPTGYAVVGTNSTGCSGQSYIAVIVVAGPTMNASASSTFVCKGANVVLSASGVDTYTWVGGPSNVSHTVNPTSNSTYTVLGNSISSTCTAQQILNINVFNPNITISPTPTVCAGSPATLSASGAIGYTWAPNGGTSPNISVTPTANTVYTLITNSQTTGIASCITTNTANVIVNPLPNIGATASPSTICRFESSTLTATGGTSYVWGNQQTSTSIVVTASIVGTNNFIVTGTDANGCEAKGTVALNVSNCTGLKELSGQNPLSIYPNPNKGEFTISYNQNIQLDLVNELGQLVKTISLNDQNNRTVSVNEIAPGIYFIMGNSNEGQLIQKIIVK